MTDESNPTLRDFFERSLAYQCEIFTANLKVVDTRFEAIDERFNHLQQIMDERGNAALEAKSLAAESVDERLGLLQHFRAAIDSDRAQYASVEKVEVLAEQLNELKQWKANFEGRAAVYIGGAALALTIIMFLVGLAAKFLF